MKSFLLAILLIVVIGVGGLAYRNAAEHPSQPIACPLDAEVCPDGTAVSRVGSSCTFPACPLPNVSLTSANIAFAIPDGFTAGTLPDAPSIAEYEATTTNASTTPSSIVIRDYSIDASSTALDVIEQTAVSGTSGQPVGVTSFSSSMLGTHRFTVVSIQRFEGVVDTAYYLARDTDVLRFDAIDTGVSNWSDSNLNVSTLRANSALTKLLTTLQVL